MAKSSFEEQVRDWLPGQRWYAGGARSIREVRVESATPLGEAEPRTSLLVLAVDRDGEVERYQLLLGERAELPERLEHVRIGAGRGMVWYDAAHDSDVTGRLLELVAADADVGPLRFRSVPGADPLDTALTSLAMTNEQTNTSLVFGEEYILKTFRRIAGGVNPDLEVTLALASAGSEHVASPLGWVETDLDGEPATLALLQRFLRTGTDGWLLANASVRDLYAEADLHADEVGGDFAAESERLGAATAAVHRDLAATLGSARARPADVNALVARMRRQLKEARAEVPSVAAYTDRVSALYDEVEREAATNTVQRVHGDLHLGQVMRTTDGWVLLDFEGEPARPLAERRAPTSPLKDVAGMLRSFDYAAQHLLVEQYDDQQHGYRAVEWAERNQDAFCAGYAEEAGADPREQRALLRAFEVDKAVYEAMYEARHRPTWLRIPLGALDRLMEDAEAAHP